MLLCACLVCGCSRRPFESGIHYHWRDARGRELETPLVVSWSNQLAELNPTNAVADADGAFRDSQFWFVAVAGIAVTCPGMRGTNWQQNTAFREVIDKHGFRIVSGTTDDIGTPTQAAVCSAAARYGELYNTALLELMQKRGMHNINLHRIPNRAGAARER